MTGYYRRFIPQYSEIAAPLTDLTKGPRRREINWTKECEEALQQLKGALSNPPVLVTPDFSQPFLVQTDASGRGLGAVLSQKRDNLERPIMFLSRKLTDAERKYSTIEREALAVKWAVNALRYYLCGSSFTLVTDHAPLTWLQRMKDSNARLTRWYLSLQPYAFDIEHRKGVDHTNADFLSRQETGDDWRPEDAAPVLPGEGCGGAEGEEELAQDLLLLEVSLKRGSNRGGFPARTLGRVPRWPRRGQRKDWRIQGRAQGDRTTRPSRMGQLTSIETRCSSSPRLEEWNPPRGRGIWRE